MSLSASLSIATQALLAASAEVQNTENNIANANTPGYTREVVVLQSAAPDLSAGSPQPANGVILEGFQSVRDSLLQSRIVQTTQSQSQADSELSSLQQIQTAFNSSSLDIGTEISAFFSSISSLSTNPDTASTRQSVLTAGQNLANAFNTASNALSKEQSDLNTQVTQDVDQINSLARQIAALNSQIAVAGSKDAGTLQDQQDQLILSLSKLTGINVSHTDGGVTLSIGNGAPFVDGSRALPLQTQTGPDGMTQVVDSSGRNITSSIAGGDLGGALHIRDTDIPAIAKNLDNLAQEFAEAVNAVQAKGYDQNGAVGGNFFSIPSGTSGAARAISMAIFDPSLIAASSDGSSGSNGNLANFTAIQNSRLSSGQTPTNAYASIVYQVGSLTSNAASQSKATGSSLLQLKDQLNSVSGVSIDEESANLIQYQQAYEAAARVVSTIQSLFQVIMSMGTAAAG